ncbi:MAG: multidrug resistance protein [Bacteroidetes bacterium]|nr:multidrug resistance protein [Bacteroidota bacterium]
MVGLERTILPLIAEADFGVASKAAAVAFIATFGITKAIMNLFAGSISDRWGRRSILLLGWFIGVPVPLIVMTAQSWTMVLFANVLLGMNQALCWSMTVVMKVDLAEQRQRGLALGLNEFAGYGGVAVMAAVSAYIASSSVLRPDPFVVGVAVVVVGLILSVFVRDTRKQSGVEHSTRRLGPVFRHVTWANRSLASSSLAGLMTNLKDGMLWGLLPLYLASVSASVVEIGQVVALYPATWAISQLVFGPLSDRIGRKALIVWGLGVQALGIAGFVFSPSLSGHLASSVVTGIGTAMVYPTLQAFVSDVASIEWRASALGVYRFWRDSGYAIGALGIGVVADAFGIGPAFMITTGLLFFASVLFHGLNRATAF